MPLLILSDFLTKAVNSHNLVIIPLHILEVIKNWDSEEADLNVVINLLLTVSLSPQP